MSVIPIRTMLTGIADGSNHEISYSGQ